LVVCGSGGSARGGVPEGAYTKQYLLRNLPRLRAFAAADGVRARRSTRSTSFAYVPFVDQPHADLVYVFPWALCSVFYLSLSLSRARALCRRISLAFLNGSHA
jgi:hypothetical protein